jgi:hypothetical protein
MGRFAQQRGDGLTGREVIVSFERQAHARLGGCIAKCG